LYIRNTVVDSIPPDVYIVFRNEESGQAILVFD